MFTYFQPTRIHFGENQIEKLGEVCRKYGRRGLLVTTPDQPLQALYERVKHILEKEGIQTIHFDQVEPNPGVQRVENGLKLAEAGSVEFVLAVGGGSSIDTAKAIAFNYGRGGIDWDELFGRFSSPYEDYAPYSETALPLISVPTTSGTGSQVTQAAVITRGDEKITFYHPALFSRECILDPSLMLTLPARISAATGFDAFTHAFESYLNPHASCYSKMDSLKAMELIIANLPKVLQEPLNLVYRSHMALADTLAGRALANSGAGAPHPLSEIIGGITHLPHGEALAVVFPAFISQCVGTNQDQCLSVARLFHPEAERAEELCGFITDLLRVIGLNRKLKDLGVTEEDFGKIVSSPVLDALPFGSRGELEAILRASYE